MISIQDQQKLLALLKDFYKISGVRVGVFDSDSRELMGWPPKACPYCEALRSSPKNLELCKSCDKAAYHRASLNKDIYIYRCHAGLMEAIVPIRSQGLSLGYLMIGQIRPAAESEEERKQRLALLQDLGLDTAAISSLYKKLPAVSREQIQAYAHILQACASFIWMEDYIKLQQAPLSYRAELYIRGHLKEDITLAKLCDAFQVGKTTLCTAVKEETGKTVIELIRSIRIEESQKLLLTDALSISEIAACVGFEDYNYFTKVFRRETGLTPSAYRQAIRSEQRSTVL